MKYLKKKDEDVNGACISYKMYNSIDAMIKALEASYKDNRTENKFDLYTIIRFKTHLPIHIHRQKCPQNNKAKLRGNINMVMPSRS